MSKDGGSRAKESGVVAGTWKRQEASPLLHTAFVGTRGVPRRFLFFAIWTGLLAYTTVRTLWQPLQQQKYWIQNVAERKAADAGASQGVYVIPKLVLSKEGPRGANRRGAGQEAHSFLLSVRHFALVKFRVADSLSPNRGSWPPDRLGVCVF